MTKEEARSLIGRTVLYTSVYGGEPEKVVITDVVCALWESPDLIAGGAILLFPEN